MTEDSIYRERAHLVAFLASIHNSVIGPSSDAPGWFIVYIDTWDGQLSWHISPDDMDLFENVDMALGPFDPRMEWDGHTTEEKYKRLRKLTEYWADMMRSV